MNVNQFPKSFFHYLLLILALTTIPSTVMAAPTLFVRSDGDNACDGTVDAPGPGPGACAKLTLQAAIDAVDEEGTVQVGPGLFNEAVKITNKSVTILGAQASVDGRDRNPSDLGNETVIRHSVNGLNILNQLNAAENVQVVIDGLVVDGADTGNGYGIYTRAQKPGDSVVLQNLIVGGEPGNENTMGLYLNGDNITIQRNLFINNNTNGAASNAIYGGDQEGIINGLIQDNTFVGSRTCGVNLAANSEGGGYFAEVIVRNNLFDGEGCSVGVAGGKDVLIENNQMLDCRTTCVDVNGGAQPVTIRNNFMTRDPNTPGANIRIRDNSAAFTFGVNQEVNIIRNQLLGPDTGNPGSSGIIIFANGLDGNSNVQIHFNRIFQHEGIGLASSSNIRVEAQNNWWGCNEGPLNANCDQVGFLDPNNLNFTVDGSVAIFDPWLVLDLLADPEIITTVTTSDLTGTLLFNSAGINVSNINTLADQTPGLFSANEGDLNPESTTSVSGILESVYESTLVGAKQVCVNVDNTTVCKTIEVTPAPEEPTVEEQETPLPVSPLPPLAGNPGFVEGSGCAASLLPATRGGADFLLCLVGSLMVITVLRFCPK